VISVEALLDGEGVLRSCKASGHAGAGKPGNDIVCAAVSVLMRTALKTLEGKKGIKLSGGAPERGVLWLEAEFTAEGRGYLAAAGDFLIEGLRSVAVEFPQNCTISIRRT
jgi:uncharacterized protein YsxB (DUF464 family)